MISKVIIIPPDDAPNNTVFSYTIPKGNEEICHDNVLLEFCTNYSISKNTVQTMPSIGYVVIYTVGGEYIIYFSHNLTERQLMCIKELFDKEIEVVHLGFIQEKRLFNAGNVKSFDEFMSSYNNLNKTTIYKSSLK